MARHGRVTRAIYIPPQAIKPEHHALFDTGRATNHRGIFVAPPAAIPLEVWEKAASYVDTAEIIVSGMVNEAMNGKFKLTKPLKSVDF